MEHETGCGVEHLHRRLATVNFQHVIEHGAVELTRLCGNLRQSFQTLDVLVLHLGEVKVVEGWHGIFFGSDGLVAILGQESDLALEATAGEDAVRIADCFLRFVEPVLTTEVRQHDQRHLRQVDDSRGHVEAEQVVEAHRRQELRSAVGRGADSELDALIQLFEVFRLETVVLGAFTFASGLSFCKQLVTQLSQLGCVLHV